MQVFIRTLAILETECLENKLVQLIQSLWSDFYPERTGQTGCSCSKSAEQTDSAKGNGAHCPIDGFVICVTWILNVGETAGLGVGVNGDTGLFFVWVILAEPLGNFGYLLPDSSYIVVGRSKSRLFYFGVCKQKSRGNCRGANNASE